MGEAPLPDHDTLAVVLYHSAESFIKLTGSETLLKAAPVKEAAVAENYSFGLHRCIVGCEDTNHPIFPAQIQGKVLVIQYSMPNTKVSEIEQMYYKIRDTLALDGRATLAYGGRLVGQSFYELDDGSRIRQFNSEGVDGTLIFEVENLENVEQILAINEIASFIDKTTADVVVTFAGIKGEK